MNLFRSLMDGAPVWFGGLLMLSLQAAVLAGIVWFVLKAVGRWIPPAWRALLWFLVIVRVLVPIAPPSPFSLQNLLAKSSTTSVRATAPQTFTTKTILQPDLGNISPAPNFDGAPLTESMALLQKGKLLVGLWAAGSGICFAAMIGRYLVIRRRLALKDCEASALVVQNLADCREAMRLRYPIHIAVSDRIAAPALTGLFPARLIVPTDFAEQNLTPSQVRHVLMHELAHVCQGHLILHWLSLIARAVHWFNPALHFAAARLRQECELAADEAALKNSTAEQRTAYGETLLKILSHNLAPSSRLALGMAEHAVHMKERLQALTIAPTKSFRALGALVVLIVSVAGLSGADTKTAPIVNAPSSPSPKDSSEQRTTSRNSVQLSVSTTNKVSPPSATTNAPLFTRTYRIDPKAFLPFISTNGFPSQTASSEIKAAEQAVAALSLQGFALNQPPDFSKITNQNGAASAIVIQKQNLIQSRVRAFLAASGVDFVTNLVESSSAPPQARKALFFNDLTGALYARASLSDLDKVELALHALNTSAAQISFNVRVFEMTPFAKLDFFTELMTTNTAARILLSTNEYLSAVAKSAVSNPPPQLAEAREIAKVLKVPVKSTITTANALEYLVSNLRANEIAAQLSKLKEVQSLNLPALTTAVGRVSIISAQDTITVVTENTNLQGNTIGDDTVRLDVGKFVRIESQFVSEKSVSYRAIFNFPEFFGYANDSSIPLPQVRLHSTTALSRVPHGQTQIIVVLAHPEDTRRYVLFVTPTVIDPAGKPIAFGNK